LNHLTVPLCVSAIVDPFSCNTPRCRGGRKYKVEHSFDRVVLQTKVFNNTLTKDETLNHLSMAEV
jgi:hypothetical protein